MLAWLLKTPGQGATCSRIFNQITSELKEMCDAVYIIHVVTHSSPGKKNIKEISESPIRHYIHAHD